MKQQEKEITQRYEKAKKEFLEARAEFNKISSEIKNKKLNKKYAGKYFKGADYNNYYFVKEVNPKDNSKLQTNSIFIGEDSTTINIDYEEYISIFKCIKSNKLEFTNALNVAMDRLFNLKKLMI
jgi:hypothetical protein